MTHLFKVALTTEDDEIKAAKENCSCDNCFYGRTKLAEELLRYVSNGT
jgi:hypothetical protein